MKITVIGAGRWGSFIAWYLDHIGKDVSLYGREDSSNMKRFRETGGNGIIQLEKTTKLIYDLKEIEDSDLFAISGIEVHNVVQKIKLDYLQVVCGKNSIPMATVGLTIDGEECSATSSGKGPVDAAFSAIHSLVHRKINLEEMLVQSITRGTEDNGIVHIQVENNGQFFYGYSANADIVTAAAEAYVNAIAKII